MRNAGDRTPGGSAGRRHRGPSGEQPPPAAGAGGASLFTPAYRVSHAVAGKRPVGADALDASSPAGYGQDAEPGSGTNWPDRDRGPSPAGYQQPGYGASQAGQGWPDDELAAGYRWATDDQGADAWPAAGLPGPGMAGQARSNAVRGFPPTPDEALPVYPPGPFAAWNRSHAERAGGDRGARAGGPADASRQLATATITPDEFDTDYSLPAISDPIPGKAGRDGAPGRGTAQGRGTAPGSRRAPSGPGQAQPRRGNARPGGRPWRRRLSAWLAIGTAGAIIAAVAVILVITLPGSGGPVSAPRPTSTPRHANTSPTPPPGIWGFIGSRKTDPVPLSMSELFPATITNAGTLYTKAKEIKGRNCHAALIGSELQAAVKSGECTQALRATYLSKTAKVMATIGVFNLKSAALANKAAAKAGRSEFVAQLPAKAGPAKAIGQGTGIEEAVVKGHYLVLVWAESTNLTAVPKGQAGRAPYVAFMKLLVKHTVNVSLSRRMVDGKPAQRRVAAG